ncbi:uncharacterized protein LOC143302328 [Babylonia areolata]|uniref:uncharacterized protein LOC143302328 n=1 Tax=Babylonia areolata TaxID=304850 RepID=UPI003FD52189
MNTENTDKTPQQKMHDAVKTFSNNVSRIQQVFETGDPNIDKEQVKQMIRKTFDAVRDAAVDLVDSFGSSDGSSGGQGVSHQKTPPLIVTQQKDVYNHLATYVKQKKRVAGSADEGSSGSSFETISLGDSHGAPHGDPHGDSDGDPHGDSDGDEPNRDEGTPTETISEEEGRKAVSSMLGRVGETLLGFFYWLLDKLNEIACKVWNKVCDTFAIMFTLMSDIWHYIWGGASSGQSGGSSARPHLACSALKYHAA